MRNWGSPGRNVRGQWSGPGPRTPEERFWAKVQKTDTCWLWVGAINGTGYGNFWHDSQYARAHVFAWSLANGPVPAGLSVLHHCDVRSCIRPSHLFLGTNGENSKDMVSKGRSGKGERNSQAKLTAADVLAIRVRLETGAEENAARDAAQHEREWHGVDAKVTVERSLLASLVEDADCSFDHHGGCHAHGYLSLAPGELCPQAELKMALMYDGRPADG